jgi:hypothetical protein
MRFGWQQPNLETWSERTWNNQDLFTLILLVSIFCLDCSFHGRGRERCEARSMCVNELPAPFQQLFNADGLISMGEEGRCGFRGKVWVPREGVGSEVRTSGLIVDMLLTVQHHLPCMSRYSTMPLTLFCYKDLWSFFNFLFGDHISTNWGTCKGVNSFI